MTLTSCCRRFVTTLIALSAITTSSFATEDLTANAPQDKPSQSLTRTANDALMISAALSKNAFKQEAYQAEYPVQVPYETQESYTDYEEYYEQEYRCHTENDQQCGYERECRRVPGERICRWVPGERRCRQVRECDGGGGQICENVRECGRNAQGQPICKERRVCRPGGQPNCRTREVCENGQGRQECHNGQSREICENEYRCRNRPRERCGYEQVRKTRAVTKWRTVTRYRTEMRCCVTKYRDVFDYQAELDVQVIFPQGSELVGNQTESFRVVFSGTANAPDVAIEQLTGRTKYEIDVKDIQGRQAVLLMKVKPLSYPIQEVGELSVTGLKLAIRANESAYVSFADVGQRETLETEYALMVRDEAGNVETSLTVLANTLVDQKIELPQKLSLRRTHIVELVVTRSGQGLSQDLTFSKTMIRRR